MWTLIGFVLAFGGSLGIPAYAEMHWQSARSKLDPGDQGERVFSVGLGAGMAGAILGMIGMAILGRSI